VIGSDPVALKLTLHDADPETTGSAAHPGMGVPASMKAAVPLGLTCAGETGDTVAVKTPRSPAAQVLAAAVTVVVDRARTTCWFSGAEVEPAKLASPLYTAVIA
jgi:hypothetical protein